MARSPIEIAIASETRAFKQGVDSGIIAPLEDAERQLKQLGASDAGADLERQLERGQDATKDLASDIEKATDNIERMGRASRDAGDDGVQGFGKIKGASQEVQQEIGQNLGEAVSSVRGDMSDLGQVGQDTLGGLAATLAGAGPAGIAGAALLAAGAVGLGAVTAELQEQQEQADALRDRLSSAYTKASEEGRAYIDVAGVIANVQDLVNNPERANEWQKVQETQKATGLEMSTILKANAGDLQAVSLVMSAVDAANRAATESGEEANLFLDAGGTAIQQLAGYWHTLGDSATESHGKAQAAIDFTNRYLMEQINAAQGATKEVDELGNALYTLPTGEKILVEADTGKATTDVSNFKGDLDGVPEVVSTQVRVSVDDSAWRNWRPGDKIGAVRTAVGPGGAGGTTWY